MNSKRQLTPWFNAILILALATACSLPQKKLDPSQEYSTDSGFQFRFPMSGDWYPGSPQNGMYMAGQRPTSDGTSKLAIVRHGPIYTPGGKTLTNKEILDGFRRDIENEAKGGRVSKVKSNFSQKKYGGADCLFFDQSGEDNPASGAMKMNMNNEGMICLHPNKPFHFIWMAISERWPLDKPGSPDFAHDKEQFLNSLKFIN